MELNIYNLENCLNLQDIIKHAYSLGIDKNFRTARANKENLPKEELEKALKDYENLGSAVGIDIRSMAETKSKSYGQYTDNK